MSGTNSHKSADDDASDDEKPLKFDVDALKRISAESLQKRECISISKLDEGTFNKVFLLTMDDGFECIARLALPSFPCYKSESEVATMQYLTEKTSIRVPQIYAWDANAENAVGAEYILMEKMPGVTLETIWDDLSLENKKQIVQELIDILLQLFEIPADKIGSLYKGSGDPTYRVGPLVCDLFFADERANMDLDRGPWLTTRDYLTALLRSQVDYLKAQGASTLDGTDVQKSLQTFSELESILPNFCPDNPSLERLSLLHADLHAGNVMVQQTSIHGTTSWSISGIIDWESSGVYPAWACAWYPKFIMGDNRDVKAEEADDWFDPDEFKTLLEETELRKFFRSEVSRQSLAFANAMDEGAKTRKFESKAIFARKYPKHVSRWISELGSSGSGWE